MMWRGLSHTSTSVFCPWSRKFIFFLAHFCFSSLLSTTKMVFWTLLTSMCCGALDHLGQPQFQSVLDCQDVNHSRWVCNSVAMTLGAGVESAPPTFLWCTDWEKPYGLGLSIAMTWSQPRVCFFFPFFFFLSLFCFSPPFWFWPQIGCFEISLTLSIVTVLHLEWPHFQSIFSYQDVFIRGVAWRGSFWGRWNPPHPSLPSINTSSQTTRIPCHNKRMVLSISITKK